MDWEKFFFVHLGMQNLTLGASIADDWYLGGSSHLVSAFGPQNHEKWWFQAFKIWVITPKNEGFGFPWWVITMVIIFVPSGSGCGTPSKSPNFMAYKWRLLYNHLLNGMIVQVSKGPYHMTGMFQHLPLNLGVPFLKPKDWPLTVPRNPGSPNLRMVMEAT